MALSISKSKFLAGLQCELLLWTHYNARDRIPDPGPAQQFIFDTGHLVGDLAKRLYPGGIEIRRDRPDGRPDIPATVAETARLLPQRKPLFEASFLADGRYVRVDILVPADGEAWDLYEVKSSTQVKDVNLWDVAYQYDCLTRAGVELDRLFLMHLNNTYVRRGGLDVQALFAAEDVTTEARERAPLVPGLFDRFARVIAGDEPTVDIGPHCTSPYTCPLRDRCWAGLPEHPVTEFHRVGKKAFAWMAEGMATMAEVPADRLSAVQRVQQDAASSGQARFDAAAVRSWLDSLEYPLWHLDFETMAPAIPLFDGTRPYQRIPFQFSLHVQDTPGAEPRHIEYLATEPVDPRPGLLEALRAIGPDGTVLAFNKTFEMGVLDELARDFPAHAAMCADLNSRMKDLADIFRRFQVYHPDQKGRYSLKNVLPAWTDLAYDDLEIADGQAAARAFLQAVFPEAAGLDPASVNEAGKAKVLADLRAYCGLDTLAMVKLMEVLRREAQ